MGKFRKKPVVIEAFRWQGEHTEGWRRIVRQILAYNPMQVLPLLREVSDNWCWDKDGKQWFGDVESEWMRK